MKNKDNTHDFSSNYSTHLRNIKRATKWNKKETYSDV
jgi:cell division protein YceG involved in septum cleavage